MYLKKPSEGRHLAIYQVIDLTIDLISLIIPAAVILAIVLTAASLMAGEPDTSPVYTKESREAASDKRSEKNQKKEQEEGLTSESVIPLSTKSAPDGAFIVEEKTSVETLADLSLEQLMSLEISSTSFFEIPPEKAPGSIYLISNDRIEESYASSISDFLKYYVPGVSISDAYSAGSLYSSRGTASPSNTTTLFMINGNTMNVTTGTGINTNLDLPLMGDIERIEILKGPCSIIHGSGSINGFINVIQKKGIDNQGGFVNTEVGLDSGLLKLETGLGGYSSDYGDIFLYAGGVKSDGVREKGTGDNPSVVNDNYYPNINSRFSLNWSRNNLALTAIVQNEKVASTLPRQEMEASGAASQTTGTIAGDESTISSIFPSISSSFSSSISSPLSSSISGSTRYNEQNYDSTQMISADNPQEEYLQTRYLEMKSIALLPSITLEPGGTESLTLSVPINYFEYAPLYFSASDQNLDSELQVKPGLICRSTRLTDHRVAAGCSAQLKRFSTDSIEVRLPDSSQEEINSLSFDAEVDWIETSLFFEDNYQLSDRINIFAGLRYDSVSSGSLEYRLLNDFTSTSTGEQVSAGYSKESDIGGHLDTLIPRLGIVYDIADDKTVKLIYQEGYHNPDYINMIETLSFSSPLITEKVKSYEIGYSQRFMNERLQMDLNLYNNIFNNTVFRLVDEGESEDTIDNITADEFTALGFETSLRFTPDRKTLMEVSYAFSKPDNFQDDTEINPHLVDSSGDHWKAYPEHTVKFNISRSMLNDRVMLSAGLLFNMATDTVDEIQDGDASSSSAVDLFNHDRCIVNLAARYRLSKSCSLVLKGENILDNDIPATGYYYNLLNSSGITLEHPSYTIGLNWKF